jgi:flagellar basal-body rod modification protein FlgD
MVNLSPTAGANPASGTVAPTAPKSLEGKDAFLQLLVAQIKNQNPLDPANGVEFLTQLAQFSQLEQTMGIREEISGLRTQVETVTAALNRSTETTSSKGDTNV